MKREPVPMSEVLEAYDAGYNWYLDESRGGRVVLSDRAQRVKLDDGTVEYWFVAGSKVEYNPHHKYTIYRLTPTGGVQVIGDKGEFLSVRFAAKRLLEEVRRLHGG